MNRDLAVQELVALTPLTLPEATSFVQSCVERTSPVGLDSAEVVEARLEYVVAGEIHEATAGLHKGARSKSRRRFTAASNRLWALLHPVPEPGQGVLDF